MRVGLLGFLAVSHTAEDTSVVLENTGEGELVANRSRNNVRVYRGCTP